MNLSLYHWMSWAIIMGVVLWWAEMYGTERLYKTAWIFAALMAFLIGFEIY